MMMLNRVMMLVDLEGVRWHKNFASAKACLGHCCNLNATHEVTGRISSIVNHNVARLTIVFHLLVLRRVLR